MRRSSGESAGLLRLHRGSHDPGEREERVLSGAEKAAQTQSAERPQENQLLWPGLFTSSSGSKVTPSGFAQEKSDSLKEQCRELHLLV